MKLKTILCLILGLYSIAVGAYVISQSFAAHAGCGAGCYKGEKPFGDSVSGTRNISVQYRASGNNGFGADPGKISGAISTATGNWNGAGTTYQFQPSQSTTSPTIELIVVDDIKGAPRSACMEMDTWKNQQGEIAGARLYVRRSTFNNATQTELAELLQHELGHFLGLADFYGNADQCETTMAQAKDGCHGLKGSRAISAEDVSSVSKYVTHSTDCKKPRISSPVLDTGGYVDPNPIPIYYPYTCYYYYSAYDIYYECDCRENGQYAFTIYVLDDVICF
jgi:hypothetical protein